MYLLVLIGSLELNGSNLAQVNAISELAVFLGPRLHGEHHIYRRYQEIQLGRSS